VLAVQAAGANLRHQPDGVLNVELVHGTRWFKGTELAHCCHQAQGLRKAV